MCLTTKMTFLPSHISLLISSFIKYHTASSQHKMINKKLKKKKAAKKPSPSKSKTKYKTVQLELISLVACFQDSRRTMKLSNCMERNKWSVLVCFFFPVLTHYSWTFRVRWGEVWLGVIMQSRISVFLVLSCLGFYFLGGKILYNNCIL